MIALDGFWNFLSTLAILIFLFIIINYFREEVSKLINRISHVEGLGLRLEAYKSTDSDLGKTLYSKVTINEPFWDTPGITALGYYYDWKHNFQFNWPYESWSSTTFKDLKEKKEKNEILDHSINLLDQSKNFEEVIIILNRNDSSGSNISFAVGWDGHNSITESIDLIKRKRS